MIFQQFNLFATRTVLDNVAYPLRFSGMSRRDIREKAESLLRYVELEDKRDAYPSQLSADKSSGWPLPGRWPAIPRCCCAMKRPVPWTRKPPLHFAA